MATGKALNGKPYAGNPHVRFDEGEVAPAATPRRGSLLYKEVRLLKDDGIEYSGVGKGEINGHPVKFDVKCKYDGKTVLWDASLSEDNLLSLAAKEKAKEVYDKVKALWPEVQKGIKRKYDAASKKAGEFYNAATKKVEEGIDSVKESVQSGTGEETITMPSPGQGNSQQ